MNSSEFYEELLEIKLGKNKMRTMKYDNCRMDEFSFPYPPYPIQLDLMRSLNKCIDDKKTGIFESPTGTGENTVHCREYCII